MIRFLLNHESVETEEAPGLLVLDWLRRSRRLLGTKEGCKEGDCGACGVLLGELAGAGETVVYRPMTSCLMPLAQLAGRHLVTIEGLDLGAGRLNPVQQAIVDQGGSQCGFCTPGIVLSLTSLLMEKQEGETEKQVAQGLSGHLCRCTGYRSLKEAGAEALAAVADRGVPALVEAGVLPQYFGDIPARLAAAAAIDIPGLGVGAGLALPFVADAGEKGRASPAPTSGPEPPGPDEKRGPGGESPFDRFSPLAVRGEGGRGERSPSPPVVIGGGTDLYVQQGEDLPARRVVLAPRPAGVPVRRDGVTLHVAAGATFQQLADDPELRGALPELGAWMDEIASWQIRNRATLGGNIVNASPIGDLTVLFLAWKAELLLDLEGRERTLPLRDFFQAYKKTALQPGEILREVSVDAPPGFVAGWEKVAKRRALDIATVNLALTFRLDAEGRPHGVGLAAGGVAPIPLALRRCEALLEGARVDHELAAAVLATAQEEIAPISDVRGSADYKRLLVRQLLIAQLTRHFPAAVSVEDFYRNPDSSA